MKMKMNCFLQVLHLNQNSSLESIRVCSSIANVFLLVVFDAAVVAVLFLLLLLLVLVFLRGVTVDCFYSHDSIDASRTLRVRVDADDDDDGEIFAVL